MNYSGPAQVQIGGVKVADAHVEITTTHAHKKRGYLKPAIGGFIVGLPQTDPNRPVAERLER